MFALISGRRPPHRGVARRRDHLQGHWPGGTEPWVRALAHRRDELLVLRQAAVADGKVVYGHHHKPPGHVVLRLAVAVEALGAQIEVVPAVAAAWEEEENRRAGHRPRWKVHGGGEREPFRHESAGRKGDPQIDPLVRHGCPPPYLVDGRPSSQRTPLRERFSFPRRTFGGSR